MQDFATEAPGGDLDRSLRTPTESGERLRIDARRTSLPSRLSTLASRGCGRAAGSTAG